MRLLVRNPDRPNARRREGLAIGPALATLAAAIGGGALLGVLLVRRRERDSDPDDDRPTLQLGSLGTQRAITWFEDAAQRRNAGGGGFEIQRDDEADPYRNRTARDRLVYRPVGAAGEPYPPWVRALKGKSGVYVIRDRASGEPLYVGQSAGNLYETMTRHLQQWRRWKSWWRGQYADGTGNDPGVSYDRAAVEVATRVLSPDRAIDEEARLIRTLEPRDNVNRTDANDDTPF